MFLNSDLQALLDGVLNRGVNDRPAAPVSTSVAALSRPGGARAVSEALGLREPPPPAPAAKNSADPDLAGDALLDEVADQLDPADLAAIRADPEAKRRFARRLQNQRGLNAEKRQEREAADAEAQALAKAQEQSRLGALGQKLAKAEADK